MTYPPNIFNYATKELTQDAFITWLLHWADSEHKLKNEPLHLLGKSFLASLLARQNIILEDDFSDYKIIQQNHRIDVFVSLKFNDTTYGIIIEDKVHSTDHSNQLEIYKKKIVDKKICDVLLLIYFKTGYQVNLSRIKENGYHYYSIKDFLKLIPQEKIAQINNDVLSQYYSYLLTKEIDYDYADNQANNYLIKPLKEWTWWTCIRFFHDYKEHFHAKWGEVANNREALLAFWFGGKDFPSNDIKNQRVLLQIYMDIVFKKNKLVVSYRISLKQKEQINVTIRNQIFNDLVPYLNENKIECRKANYKNAENTMLLAEITNLDMDMNYAAFVKQLEVYQSVLDKFVEFRCNKTSIVMHSEN